MCHVADLKTRPNKLPGRSRKAVPLGRQVRAIRITRRNPTLLHPELFEFALRVVVFSWRGFGWGMIMFAFPRRRSGASGSIPLLFFIVPSLHVFTLAIWVAFYCLGYTSFMILAVYCLSNGLYLVLITLMLLYG